MVIRLTILIFFNLILAVNSLAESSELSFRVQGGSKIPMNVDFYKDGRFHNNEYDVSWSYKICEENSEFNCVVTSTQFLIFSVPKNSLSLGDEWIFSGYKFEVIAENNNASKYLYFIESKPTDALKYKLVGNKASIPLKKIIFLYSKADGLLSFSKHFENVVENWVVRKD